jgi:hypothetical protein
MRRIDREYPPRPRLGREQREDARAGSEVEHDTLSGVT